MRGPKRKARSTTCARRPCPIRRSWACSARSITPSPRHSSRPKDALGGGEENIAGDGETLIGRIYSVELFGEQTEPSTAYDGSGKVSVVSIYLSGAESEPYYEKLVELYGEPDESSEGEASESGATWESWNIDGAQLRLVQSYGLCTLELTVPSTAVG